MEVGFILHPHPLRGTTKTDQPSQSRWSRRSANHSGSNNSTRSVPEDAGPIQAEETAAQICYLFTLDSRHFYSENTWSYWKSSTMLEIILCYKLNCQYSVCQWAEYVSFFPSPTHFNENKSKQINKPNPNRQTPHYSEIPVQIYSFCQALQSRWCDATREGKGTQRIPILLTLTATQ